MNILCSICGQYYDNQSTAGHVCPGARPMKEAELDYPLLIKTSEAELLEELRKTNAKLDTIILQLNKIYWEDR